MIVHELKSSAEIHLQNQNYPEALCGYSQALNVAYTSNVTYDEIPKILCNRSMVLLKMRKCNEAFDDACNSIQGFPYWIKVN